VSVKHEWRGTGVTRAERATVDFRNGVGPEEIEATAQMYRAWVDPIEEARRICEAVAGDLWRERRAAIQEAIESNTPTEMAAALGNTIEISEDSPEDFALRILDLIDRASKVAGRGETESAARLHFRAGWLFAVAGMKFQWEADAVRGKSVIEAARHGQATAFGTEEQKAAKRAEVRKASQAFHARNPGASQGSTNRHLAKEFGVSERTIRRYLAKP